MSNLSQTKVFTKCFSASAELGITSVDYICFEVTDHFKRPHTRPFCRLGNCECYSFNKQIIPKFSRHFCHVVMSVICSIVKLLLKFESLIRSDKFLVFQKFKLFSVTNYTNKPHFKSAVE